MLSVERWSRKSLNPSVWTVVAVEKSVCCDIAPNKYCFRTRRSGGSTFPDSGSELLVVLVAAQALVAEVVDLEINVGL